VISAYAQGIKDMERQKKQLEQDISYTNSLIDRTKAEQKTSLDNLSLVKTNIDSRKTLVSNIDKQLILIGFEIAERQKRIATLYEDLARLKEDYAKMINFAYRNRNAYTQVMYILASEDINQAYRRISYLKSYSDYRIDQAKTISQQSEKLNVEINALKISKIEQELLLGQKNLEIVSLDVEEKSYQNILAGLENRERELLRDLDSKKRQAAQLDKQIENAIAEEARKEAERRREAERRSKESATRMAANEQVLNAVFEKNKGKLPMPVFKGVVVTHFGVYDHPVLKGIRVTSNGIDISTDPRAVVAVVADGVVRKVFSTGSVTSVLIQHGQYYSVYTHLSSVSVQSGDNVRVRQPIGLVDASSSGDRSILHFELWKQTVKLDPEQWLSNTFK
jgi:septal ring factor EnvC (AmiA/AmiB activator)